MDMVIGWWIDLFVFLRLGKHLHLCFLPNFFRDNRLMQTINQKVIVLFHKVILVARSTDFFCLSASIGDFATIDWILQDHSD